MKSNYKLFKIKSLKKLGKDYLWFEPFLKYPWEAIDAVISDFELNPSTFNLIFLQSSFNLEKGREILKIKRKYKEVLASVPLPFSTLKMDQRGWIYLHLFQHPSPLRKSFWTVVFVHLWIQKILFHFWARRPERMKVKFNYS